MSCAPHQRGNILFLILLAIILFAALAAAVTKSVGNGGKDLTEEKAELLAGQVIQDALMVEKSLERFLLTNPTLKLETIDLYKGGITRGGDNDSCASGICNLFSTSGGNINPPVLPLAATDPDENGYFANCIKTAEGNARPYLMVIGVGDIGTNAPELVWYQCGVRKEVCEQINYKMGVRTASESHINNTFGSTGTPDYTSFDGPNVNPWPTNLTVGRFGAVDARLKGKRTFCVESKTQTPTSTTGNFLIHVLVAR